MPVFTSQSVRVSRFEPPLIALVSAQIGEDMTTGEFYLIPASKLGDGRSYLGRIVFLERTFDEQRLANVARALMEDAVRDLVLMMPADQRPAAVQFEPVDIDMVSARLSLDFYPGLEEIAKRTSAAGVLEFAKSASKVRGLKFQDVA